MTIGFIGLGAMGTPMVKSLLTHEYTVLVYDIDSNKMQALERYGALSKDKNHIATESDVIILCLPHPDHSMAVVHELIQTMPKGKTIIETSTLTPEITTQLSKAIIQKQVNYLCAPMLAGATKAEAGDIHFIVEGNKEVLAEVMPILKAMGNKVTYVGEPPIATVTKMVRNLARFANVAAAIEGIQLLKQYSNDITDAYEVLVEESNINFDHVWESAMKSVALENTPYKASHISVKDLELILKLGKKHQLELPTARATLKIHQKYQ
jgi:3-hydroxyisobutyrate dehydrogenase-like beta-hydroxyacid dehydrogenase